MDPLSGQLPTLALQAIATSVAGYGLWRFWRRFSDLPAPLFQVIAWSLVIRCWLGLGLFWISYLQLPFLRSLQRGEGTWFFASDGTFYMERANAAADDGLVGILAIKLSQVSRFFVQLLAALIGCFGHSAAVALLLNAFAFLATSAVILWLGRDARVPTLVALCIVGFAPASVLWSLQPLKDAFALGLVVAAVGIIASWDRAAASGRSALGRLAGSAALAPLLFALSSIRWYVALSIWGAAIAAAISMRSPGARASLLRIAVALLFFASGQAIVVGGSAYLPAPVREVLTLVGPPPSAEAIRQFADHSRTDFDSVPAATTIRSGPLLASVSGSTAGQAPRTRPMRLLAGTTAMFLPRTIGQGLGLVRIGGAAAMWALAEIDTILLDGLLAFVLYCGLRTVRWRDAIRTPSFVAVLLIAAGTVIPVVDSVSNFGTLFRLRYTSFVMLALLPVCASRSRAPRDAMRV